MKRVDRISSAFFLALSIAVGLQAVHLNVGSIRNPGQGFVPFLASACIGILSLWNLLNATVLQRGLVTGENLKINLAKTLPVIGVLVCYSVLLSSVGFLLTTFLLFIFFFRIMARMPWLKALLASAAVSVASSLFFVVWLQCQLPVGIVGF